MRKPIVAVLLAAALTLLSTAITGWALPQAGSAVQKSTSTSAHKTTTTTPRSSASLLNPSSLKLQAPDVFDAKFVTSKGDFVVEVTRRWAPLGADRFYNLVKYHFFDNAAFFRVMQGFVAQFGLNPRPDVTRAWENTRIEDDPVTQSNTRGTLTFATAGPNTRTTQIFINLGDNTNLDSMEFSPFGKITSGMDVVDKLYYGYGDGPPDGQGPDQNRIQREGKPYLDRGFPLLDVIKTTLIVPPPPAAPSKPPTATSKPAVTSK
jgi:peptidyl-prolyl cis-trans isomerase A (cyclophilin A)